MGRPVAVVGMGGAGKSVLVSAMARDAAVRRTFTDGVVWVSVGRDCKPVQAQKRLAAVLGSDQQFSDEDPAVGLPGLRELLDSRRCLVIADDLWDVAAFRALDAVKPPGRLIFTTRDDAIVRGVGAVRCEVDKLDLEQARAVLAAWVGLEPDYLPPQADALCLEAGNLALAVAMIGALVGADGGGAQWNEAWSGVLDHLRQHDLGAIGQVFRNYDYTKLLRAIQVSIEALTIADQRRYFDLAVFDGQGPVPGSAVEALWASAGLTTSAIRVLVRRLADRSLLRRGADGWISLHDLQFDVATHYLAQESVGVAGTHDRLLIGYWARLQHSSAGRRETNGAFFSDLARRLNTASPDDWLRTGADDGYLLGHLAYHLAAASRTRELGELLTCFAWLDLGLQTRDVTGLLGDYTYAPQDQDTAVVHQTLQMSAHALAADPSELPGQLIGRIPNHVGGAVRRLVADANDWVAKPWLCPRGHSLSAPGGPLLYTLLHYDTVLALAITLDGARAVTGSGDHTARVWNLISGRCEHVLAGHTDAARAVTGSGDHTARVWNLISGRCEHVLAGHTDAVAAVAVSADGARAVTGSGITLRGSGT